MSFSDFVSLEDAPEFFMIWLYMQLNSAIKNYLVENFIRVVLQFKDRNWLFMVLYQ